MGPIGTHWNIRSDLTRERWTGSELLALRAWRLVRWSEDDGVRLLSLSHDDIWHGPVFTADHAPQAVPMCGSGVYAVKASSRPRRDSYSFDWLAGPNTWIWGWVALSGQVVEHVEGFRAQRAVVRRLHLGVQAHLACSDQRALAGLVRELEERYECPVKLGYWETRKSFRIRSLVRPTGAGQPRIEAVRAVAPIAAAPAATVTPALRSTAPIGVPASRPAAPAAVPAPAATARRPRWPPSKDVVRAFQKAERELGAKWPLMGRGHCRRVSIRGWYSRFVRPATKCWLRFTPHESGFPIIVFPLAVVQRAARILRVKAEVLIGQEY